MPVWWLDLLCSVSLVSVPLVSSHLSAAAPITQKGTQENNIQPPRYETIVFSFSPPHKKNLQITEDLGNCTAEHPGTNKLLVLSAKTRQCEAEESFAMLSCTSLVRSTSCQLLVL